MKMIKVNVSTGYVGSRRTEIFEVDESATDDEIDKMAQDILFDSMIEWGWEVVTEDTEED